LKIFTAAKKWAIEAVFRQVRVEWPDQFLSPVDAEGSIPTPTPTELYSPLGGKRRHPALGAGQRIAHVASNASPSFRDQQHVGLTSTRFLSIDGTDATIHIGNSGGPLFDVAGRIVGIASAIVAEGVGIGFAIPVDLAEDVVPQLLREKGKSHGGGSAQRFSS
jgi:hypothetical protein